LAGEVGCGRKIGPYDCCTIVTGDAKELAKAIPDESVDLIFTDPPYPEEFLYVWDDLAQYAEQVLKNRASLLTLLGHYQLPYVLRAFEKSTLRYHWIGWIVHAQKSTSMAFRTVRGGKPLLWFAKGQPLIKYGFFWDTLTGTGADKQYHKWGQPLACFKPHIEVLTDCEDIVLDPFCGGGTVPAVCKMLGRHYLAFEIEPDVAERARERVRNTQPPLFVMEPEQAEMAL